MKPLYQIRNAGGYCPEHECGSQNSALPPIWVVDYLYSDGSHKYTSPSFNTYKEAEKHLNDTLEAYRVATAA